MDTSQTERQLSVTGAYSALISFIMTNALKIVPKFLFYEDFLPREINQQILDNTIDDDRAFHDSKVGQPDSGASKSALGDVVKSFRNSRKSGLIESHRIVLLDRLKEVMEHVCATLGDPMPNEYFFELERIAHNDGGHFRRHRDTHRFSKSTLRVMTGVYYYFTTPQKFHGGALRLHSLDSKSFVDITPKNNSIVFFSSIVLHEVLPVSVPSQLFKDSRFSINCWLSRNRS